MQEQAVKELINRFTIEELCKFEQKMIDGHRMPKDKIPGGKPSEQLEHISVAMWCLQQSEINGSDPIDEIANSYNREKSMN